MKLRSFVVVAGFALLSLAARAQTGIFLNPIAIRVSNSIADRGLFAFLGQGASSRMFYGVNFGVYYDAKIPYPFKAGIEMRDSLLHGSGAELNNFLVGVRISGTPFTRPFKPYVEPVVGLGTSRAPFTAIHISKAEYGILAGMDYATQHHIDLRIVEIGYTSLATIANQAIPSSKLLTLSTGLVFRFP